jgi:hypothetical protein
MTARCANVQEIRLFERKIAPWETLGRGATIEDNADLIRQRSGMRLITTAVCGRSEVKREHVPRPAFPSLTKDT